LRWKSAARRHPNKNFASAGDKVVCIDGAMGVVSAMKTSRGQKRAERKMGSAGNCQFRHPALISAANPA
jgi:hypothetical protein